MTQSAGHEFFVVMAKRKDGNIYPDLHKTSEHIYFTYEAAERNLPEDKFLRECYHVVRLVAYYEEPTPTLPEVNTKWSVAIYVYDGDHRSFTPEFEGSEEECRQGIKNIYASWVTSGMRKNIDGVALLDPTGMEWEV